MVQLPAETSADELLQTLLHVSLNGVIMLSPVYGPDGSEPVDFALDYLNTAAQHKLGLPECPGVTVLTRFPTTQSSNFFAFYQQVFKSGEVSHYDLHYQLDNIDHYFQVMAQRTGSRLIASFTDTQVVVGQALQQNQARQEEARRQAEIRRRRLHDVLMEAPANIALFTGPDHVYEFVNPRYQKLFPGRTLLGRPVRDVLPELESKIYFEALDRVYQTGEPFYGYEMETWIDYTSTGLLEEGYFNVSFQALRDAEGNPDGILNFAYNVTEQVLARQQVQHLNADLASINAKLASINEELVTSNEELNLLNLQLEHTQQQLRELNQELEAHVAARTRQLQAALRETEQQREQLRQQQQMLQHILGQVPASIATLTGPEHRYTFFNASYHALTAGRAQLGRTVAEQLPELAEQDFLPLLNQVYATGQPFRANEKPILLYNPATSQTEQRYLDFVYQPLLNEQQQPYAILVFIVEATEKVRARQQVQALNEQLAVINQELHSANCDLGTTNAQLTRTNVDLDAFIYTASHDLKAPIINIEGLLTTLCQELPPAGQAGVVPVLLEMMQVSVNRFKRTIEHLTDVSRLQQEHGQTAPQVRLEEVLRDVCLDLAPLIAGTSAQIEPDVEACPTVSFSEKNLRSVLYNLLSNALKYRHPDRAPLVRIACRIEGPYSVLTVADNGLGLDLSRGRGLFTMFQRFHTHVEGSGVGLYMVKKMVENAGGKVEVASEPGQGSTFSVYFKR
ncbi:PAS domain-containing sensor histidine kinase [Hymenobacter cavernae]|uniref:histidine kinase n=1 Tax=Hymenobacter cavernae TaxID=2044852 RepID=A0ABQ1U7W0_9BACT|nr:ATP-binding protein [Hymenobacter cavernae]GGF12354.1 hypothetical protein GCM10011383_24470 [Hymenobacter cavernae]